MLIAKNEHSRGLTQLSSKIPQLESCAATSQLENNGENNLMAHQGCSGSFIASAPIYITGSQLIETFTSINEQIVAGLATQASKSAITTRSLEIPSSFIPQKLCSKPWYFQRQGPKTCRQLPAEWEEHFGSNNKVLLHCLNKTAALNEKKMQNCKSSLTFSQMWRAKWAICQASYT